MHNELEQREADRGLETFFQPDENFVGTKGLVFIGNEVLAYRRGAEAPKYPLCIDVPGGGVEAGETPFETFKREVKEEFGLDINQGQIVYARRYPSSKVPDEFGWYTVAKLPESVKNQIVFGDEGIGYYLMTLSEFLRRDDAWPAYQKRAADYANRHSTVPHDSF